MTRPIDQSFEKYIGMPYTAIPSPLGTEKTYAKEMEDIFLNELAQLDKAKLIIFITNRIVAHILNPTLSKYLKEKFPNKIILHIRPEFHSFLPAK